MGFSKKHDLNLAWRKALFKDIERETSENIDI